MPSLTSSLAKKCRYCLSKTMILAEIVGTISVNIFALLKQHLFSFAVSIKITYFDDDHDDD